MGWEKLIEKLLEIRHQLVTFSRNSKKVSSLILARVTGIVCRYSAYSDVQKNKLTASYVVGVV